MICQLYNYQFWRQVDKSLDCWNWKGGCTGAGYGSFTSNGSNLLAHRISYTLTIGPIAEGMTLDHLCRNTRCVNPDHLEPVTLLENIRRASLRVTVPGELVERYRGGMSIKEACAGTQYTISTVRLRLLELGVMRSPAESMRMAVEKGKYRGHGRKKGYSHTTETKEKISRLRRAYLSKP